MVPQSENLLLPIRKSLAISDNEGSDSGKMLDNISDCTKILLLQFTDQIAKSRANRGNYVITRGKISKRETFE